MSISDAVDTEFPKESDRQRKKRDRSQKNIYTDSELISSDSSEDVDDV